MAESRKLFHTLRRADARALRPVNAAFKKAERVRRDARMMDKIKRGSLPFTPAVMSWLSRKLDMPASRILPEDLKRLTA